MAHQQTDAVVGSPLGRTWQWSRRRVAIDDPRIVGALLVVGFVLLQLVYLKPPSPLDPMVYFQAAANFPDVALEHRAIRYGVVLPVALLTEVFGYSTIAYYALPLLSGVIMITGVFVLGHTLFGSGVGVAAAVLVGANGFVMDESSLLMPDLLTGGLFTLAVGLLLHVGQRIGAREAVEPLGRYEITLLIASGALLGWSYLTREFIVFLFPLIPLIVYLLRMPWRAFVVLALPAVALLAGEMVLNLAIHGDPLARLAVAGDHGQSGLASGVRADSFQNKTPGEILARFPEILGRRTEGLAMLGLLVALLVGTIATGDRRLKLLLAWFLLFWLILTLVGGLLYPSSPSLRIQLVRYWFPVFPAILVGGIGALVLLVRGLPRIQAIAVSAVLVSGCSVLALAGMHEQTGTYRATGATHLGQLRSWLSVEGRDIDTIWSDGYTAELLPLAARTTLGRPVWSGKSRIFAPDAPPEPSTREGRPSAVVLYGARGDSRQSQPCGACKLLAEQTLGRPAALPTTWRLAARTPDGVLAIYVSR